VGSPSQEAQLLLDLTGSTLYAFTKSSHTFMTRPDKFYNKAESATSRYSSSYQLFTDSTSGFEFQTQVISDDVCIQRLTSTSSHCSHVDFHAVIVLQQNYWNYGQDLSNIGGIIGLDTTPCGSCNNIWQDTDYQNHAYTLILGSENDFDWFYEANGGE
jgi:hypothetical protein